MTSVKRLKIGEMKWKEAKMPEADVMSYLYQNDTLKECKFGFQMFLSNSSC